MACSSCFPWGSIRIRPTSRLMRSPLPIFVVGWDHCFVFEGGVPRRPRRHARRRRGRQQASRARGRPRRHRRAPPQGWEGATRCARRNTRLTQTQPAAEQREEAVAPPRSRREEAHDFRSIVDVARPPPRDIALGRHTTYDVICIPVDIARPPRDVALGHVRVRAARRRGRRPRVRPLRRAAAPLARGRRHRPPAQRARRRRVVETRRRYPRRAIARSLGCRRGGYASLVAKPRRDPDGCHVAPLVTVRRRNGITVNMDDFATRVLESPSPLPTARRDLRRRARRRRDGRRGALFAQRGGYP